MYELHSCSADYCSRGCNQLCFFKNRCKCVLCFIDSCTRIGVLDPSWECTLSACLLCGPKVVWHTCCSSTQCERYQPCGSPVGVSAFSRQFLLVLCDDGPRLKRWGQTIVHPHVAGVVACVISYMSNVRPLSAYLCLCVFISLSFPDWHSYG